MLPQTLALQADTPLTCIYFAAGAHPARELYEAYPSVQGLHYGSSMNGHAPAVALNERAQSALPRLPLFHRALNDYMLVDVLQRIALRLSYGLR
jgi:hypothetical protein